MITRHAQRSHLHSWCGLRFLTPTVTRCSASQASRMTHLGPFVLQVKPPHTHTHLRCHRKLACASPPSCGSFPDRDPVPRLRGRRLGSSSTSFKSDRRRVRHHCDHSEGRSAAQGPHLDQGQPHREAPDIPGTRSRSPAPCDGQDQRHPTHEPLPFAGTDLFPGGRRI